DRASAILDDDALCEAESGVAFDRLQFLCLLQGFMDDDNSLIAERRAKLAAIRARGVPFPNDFKPRDRALELVRRHGHLENEALEPQQVAVSVAGRMMLKRLMGKASFATLQDASGRIQLFVTRDALGEE